MHGYPRDTVLGCRTVHVNLILVCKVVEDQFNWIIHPAIDFYPNMFNWIVLQNV